MVSAATLWGKPISEWGQYADLIDPTGKVGLLSSDGRSGSLYSAAAIANKTLEFPTRFIVTDTRSYTDHWAEIDRKAAAESQARIDAQKVIQAQEKAVYDAKLPVGTTVTYEKGDFTPITTIEQAKATGLVPASLTTPITKEDIYGNVYKDPSDVLNRLLTGQPVTTPIEHPLSYTIKEGIVGLGSTIKKTYSTFDYITQAGLLPGGAAPGGAIKDLLTSKPVQSIYDQAKAAGSSAYTAADYYAFYGYLPGGADVGGVSKDIGNAFANEIVSGGSGTADTGSNTVKSFFGGLSVGALIVGAGALYVLLKK